MAVYRLPSLEPEAVRTLLRPIPAAPPRVQRATPVLLGRAMACVRADLFHSVVLAHAWVTGGELQRQRARHPGGRRR